MEIKNCKECGRLFNYLGGAPICPGCKQKTEDKFTQVKEYIRNHPGAGIQEVSDENEVDVKQIKQWIREERLTFSKDSSITIECESCGAPIRSGRFCMQCVNKMQSNLAKGINKPVVQERKDTRDKDRMRFIDNNRV